MADLRISEQARRDLRDIKQTGIEIVGAERAAGYLNGFGRLFRLLREHPLAGQERSDIEEGVRSLSHRPYRILYEVDIDAVTILRIIHQARDLRPALRDEQ